jgi:hypothetical protein
VHPLRTGFDGSGLALLAVAVVVVVGGVAAVNHRGRRRLGSPRSLDRPVSAVTLTLVTFGASALSAEGGRGERG